MNCPSLIYTVGRRDIYESYLDADLSAAKAKGGSVWRTREEAQSYLEATRQSDYSVFGVVADWNRDTEFVLRAKWRALTKNAYLVRLPENRL